MDKAPKLKMSASNCAGLGLDVWSSSPLARSCVARYHYNHLESWKNKAPMGKHLVYRPSVIHRIL